MSTPVLDVAGLAYAYPDGHQALYGVDLHVHQGERVALLGPNGAGKTTLLRAISGLLPVNGGTVRFGGADMAGADPRTAARAGLVHVIEGHRVFTQISVTDNLLLAGYDLPRRERMARIEEALEARNVGTEEPFELAISVGMAEADPGEAVDLWDLTAAADAAMLAAKRAKKAGRNGAETAGGSAADDRRRWSV